jgi:hypothetical protein
MREAMLCYFHQTGADGIIQFPRSFLVQGHEARRVRRELS